VNQIIEIYKDIFKSFQMNYEDYSGFVLGLISSDIKYYLVMGSNELEIWKVQY